MDHRASIHEAAERTNLSAHTLRYYERLGLIPSVARNQGGHRLYGEQDLAWIHFLLCLKATGMGISDMKRFAKLRSEGTASTTERRKLLEAHRDQLEARLKILQSNLEILQEKIHHYRDLEASARG